MSFSIEQRIGQLIIAGFRGKTIENNSDILNFANVSVEKEVLFTSDIFSFSKGTLMLFNASILMSKEFATMYSWFSTSMISLFMLLPN